MAYICSRYQLLIIDDVTLYSSSYCLFNRSKNNQTRLIKSDYILFMIIIVLAVIGLIKLLMGTINVLKGATKI